MKKLDMAKENLIIKVKDSIFKYCRLVMYVEVFSQKNGKDEFVTRINVQLPKKKRLVTLKSNKNFKIALQQAHQAILKQINKAKYRKKTYSESIRFLEVA